MSPTDVATGLSPTWSACVERGRRLGALAEQQVALGDADVGPHQRRVLADLGRRLGHLAEAPDRLVGRARVAGDLGSAISNQTHAPIALVASARSAAGSSSSRASA